MVTNNHINPTVKLHSWIKSELGRISNRPGKGTYSDLEKSELVTAQTNRIVELLTGPKLSKMDLVKSVAEMHPGYASFSPKDRQVITVDLLTTINNLHEQIARADSSIMVDSDVTAALTQLSIMTAIWL